MGSLGTQLARTGGRPAGFDYMRLGLSIAVIAFHSCMVSYGASSERGLWTGPLGPFIFANVPAFFALSGFLVAGSLQRNDLPSFLTLRAVRIFPGLLIEVVLSAMILGVAFTTLPLAEYLSHPMFHAYFLNILGDIHYTLPGVFNDLPTPGLVNVQLWTIPFELQCYTGLSLLALLRLHKRPVLYLSVIVAAVIAVWAHGLVTDHVYPGYGRPTGNFLTLSFLTGVGLYGMRDRIPFSPIWGCAAALLAYLCLTHGETHYLALLPIAYLVVFLGLCDPPRSLVVLGADYSYGMYLYGFPIQQSLAALLPGTRIWYINLILSVAVSACFAAFSWHCIEKPILARKKLVVRLVHGLAFSHPLLRWLFRNDSSASIRRPQGQEAS